MFKFIREASGELEHVVWPTPKENKKYMIYTIGVIVTIGAFLSVLGFFMTNGLSLTRAQFPHDTINAALTSSGEDTINQEELDKILQNITVNTGTTTSDTTSLGSDTLSATGSK